MPRAPRMPAARAVAWLALSALAVLAAPASAGVLRIDGEVYAQRTAQLIPPQVDQMWQFNLTRLAPDGGTVKQGEVVMAFDSSAVVKQLAEKNSLLQEKRRGLENLQLELDERARTGALDVDKARAELDKAQRKTEQPQALIAGMAYRKLLVTREQAARKLALAQRREVAAAEQRVQQRRLLASEAAQLQSDVDRLQRSLGALDVTAPRSGLMMHKSSWSGEKFDVGSQVWFGQTVAEIPDTATLAVRAELPEREYRRVRVGTPATVRIEGGGGAVYAGKVVSIGRAVRSKSQVQPIPVLDVQIRLDRSDARLKPGMAVRAELRVADAAAAATR